MPLEPRHKREFAFPRGKKIDFQKASAEIKKLENFHLASRTRREQGTQNLKDELNEEKRKPEILKNREKSLEITEKINYAIKFNKAHEAVINAIQLIRESLKNKKLYKNKSNKSAADLMNSKIFLRDLEETHETVQLKHDLTAAFNLLKEISERFSE